ncbi:hypothetical protein EMCRGX_G027005 [Ephydatia muelleri]
MGNEDHSMGNEDLFDGERGSFYGERGGTSLRRYQIRAEHRRNLTKHDSRNEERIQIQSSDHDPVVDTRR